NRLCRSDGMWSSVSYQRCKIGARGHMKKDVSCLQAVIFDFDGTLADSYDAIAASVNHVRAARGLPPLATTEVRRHVGRGPGYLLAHTVGTGDDRHNEELYKAHHPSVMKAQTRLLGGVAEALPALKRRGLRLGVCSNKPVGFTRELLEYLGVGPL